jgi:outer membrane protein assembly factor BamB
VWRVARGPVSGMSAPITRGALMPAVAVVIAVAGCTGTATPSPAPTPRPELGPGVVWQTEVAANSHALVGDTIVAVWQNEATGIETATGKTRWRYRTPTGFTILGWGATDHAVALVMDDWQPMDPPTAELTSETIGLETATGRQIYDEPPANLYPLPDYAAHGGPPARFASDGTMFVIPWQEPGYPWYGLAGVDARTGTVSWTTEFAGIDDDCDLIDSDDNMLPAGPLVAFADRFAAVVVECARGQFVIGFDSRTGRDLWATPLPGGRPQRLIADRDAILVGQIGADMVLDSSGRVLFNGELPPERLVMAVVGDVMVVSGRNGAAAPLVGIDLRGGRTLWTRERSTSPDVPDVEGLYTYGGMTASPTAALAYRSAAVDPHAPEVDVTPFPAAVDRIDPLTGTVEQLVVPVAESGGWITVVGDVLLLDHGRGLVALRLTPDGAPPRTYLPAPPDQWPHACELITAEHLRTLWPGVDLTPVERSATVLGKPLPQPARCDFTDPYGDAFVTVLLRWVARDPDNAKTIANIAHNASAGTNVFGDHPADPMLPDVGTWAYGDATTRVTLRAGHVIATVRVWDIAVPAVEVARLVTQQLHTQGYR